MPSLAELRASKPTARPERTLTLCLAPNLVAEVQSLTEELDALPQPQQQRNADGDRVGPPQRLGEKPVENPRAVEIREALRVLLDRMVEHEGELRVRANDDGEWRRWVNQHPARPEGEPGHDRDQEVAGGYCNADDLIDSLATYAYSWDSEPLTDGDWAILAGNISGADKKMVATAVVTMHESRLDFPSWRNGLYANLERLSGSDLPGLSGSQQGGSTDGPPPSDTSISTPTGS